MLNKLYLKHIITFFTIIFMTLKHLILAAFLTITALNICAQNSSAHSDPEKQSNNLKISHLTGDYYIYETYDIFKGVRLPASSMYIVTSVGVVLIDTPWQETQVQPLLDSIAKRHHKKVVLCLVTHSHNDKTAGLDALRKHGVKTYSSKQTLDLCRQNKEKEAEFYFTKDTTFTVGNHTFQTYYPGEGHAPDNTVVWCADAKMLYGGCLVKSTESSGIGNIADANLKEWPSSIKKVMKKYPNPKYVVPGHYSWKSNKGLKHTLELLQRYNKHKSQ